MVKEYIINSKKYGKQIVLLDDEDYDKVINEKYSLSVTWDKTIKGFYVAFTAKPKNSSSRLLYRYLLNPSKGLTVDHINRNPLDNRRCNLRICTQFENNQNQKHNTSGKVGVSYNKNINKYIAYIKVKGKHKTLGEFKTFNEAVECRLKAEEKYFPNSKVVRFDR